MLAYLLTKLKWDKDPDLTVNPLTLPHYDVVFTAYNHKL